VILMINGDPVFVIIDKPKQESCWEFEVRAVTSWSRPVNSIEDVDHEPCLQGFIKWDFCSHFWFGDNDGYIHICGASDFQRHRALMKKLFEMAKEKIDNKLDGNWPNDVTFTEVPCDS
jgi:hypothetical protein